MEDEEKKYSVTSYNQMGGITAGSVNFGPQARQMNDQLGSHLKELIPTDAQVRVISLLGDGEAFGFANQVLQWLKSNGYDNVNGVDQAVYSQPVMGQNINKKSDTDYELIIGTRQ